MMEVGCASGREARKRSPRNVLGDARPSSDAAVVSRAGAGRFAERLKWHTNDPAMSSLSLETALHNSAR